MAIDTVPTRRTAARRLDLSVTAVLSAMRRGNETLHLYFDRRAGPIWWLSRSGRKLDPKVAKVVIQNPRVAEVGDSLFEGSPAQTYRYVEIHTSKDSPHV
jgi:hypothetical protein